MGQYYRIINLDKKEYIKPYDYKVGAKLMESSFITNAGETNDYMLALSNLIKTHWKGDRVVMVGDYVNLYTIDDFEFNNTVKQFYKKICNSKEYQKLGVVNEDDTYYSLYDFIDGNNFKNVKYIYDDILTNKTIPQYLCNPKTKEYVDLRNLPIEDECKDGSYLSIYPLPLLIAMGNGLGLGDYNDINKDYVGDWCDISQYIFFTNECPNGYTLYKYPFTEQKFISYLKR